MVCIHLPSKNCNNKLCSVCICVFSLYEREQLLLCHSTPTLLLGEDCIGQKVVTGGLPDILHKGLPPLLHGSSQRTVPEGGGLLQDKGVHAGMETPGPEQLHRRSSSPPAGPRQSSRELHQTQSEPLSFVAIRTVKSLGVSQVMGVQWNSSNMHVSLGIRKCVLCV